MLRLSMCPALAASALAATLATAAAQQTGVTLSPFVTFLPTGSASPMAGLSIAINGGPLALRGGAHLSLQERSATTTDAITMRPWGADADALAYLQSYSYGERIAFLPYVFAGVSTSAMDSSIYRITRQGWSYGGGLTIPVGASLGMFGEARWRMSRFVLPDASNAPPSTREFRFGLNFRVGGGGSATDVVRLISATEGSIFGDGSLDAADGANRLLSTANGYLGVPYRRGGTSPSSGFDASGFVRFVFARLGVILPRSSRDQARVGEVVRPDVRSLEPGDLVMFEDEGGIRHVAIYVGHARIIHSSETGGGVRYDDLNSDRGHWFLAHIAAARRVTPDARGMALDLARGFPDNANSDMPDHAPRASNRRR